MKTETWYKVGRFGSYIHPVKVIAWTDTTITIDDSVPAIDHRWLKTEPLRSTDGANYFATEEEAIEHSHRVVGNEAIAGRLTWA